MSEQGLAEDALVTCVRAAIAAPSIHNSQPWQFRIHTNGIDVYADRRRRLEVIDPSGREMLMSVGAALFNIRLAMYELARTPMVQLFPETAEPDLVARVTPGRPAQPNAAMSALAAAIPKRHTNRQPFARAALPAAVLDELTAAAERESATLRVADAAGRNAVLNLVRAAEERLRSRGVYRAETADPTRRRRGRRDGVPPHTIGPWHALESLPLRDFGLTLPQLSRPIEPNEPYPTILVLSTHGDNKDQWVRSGQALQRVLLVATVYNLAATPMSQPLEIPDLRDMLTDTAAGRWAQVILRLGYAPPTTPTPRRPLDDVLLGEPRAG